MKPLNILHLDVYPDRAQYRPGETGNVIVEVEASSQAELSVTVQIFKLEDLIESDRVIPVICEEGRRTVVAVPLRLDGSEWECYGVKVKVVRGDEVLAEVSTAYDEADHWRRAPRYGFLSDFRSEEEGDLKDVNSLNRYHLNVVQFYDWMYRHDSLIPPEDEFIDPMGRQLSFKVVREKVKAVQEKGMAAMAYGAVYAALKNFHEEHPDWGLYKRNGDPFHLIDIFYLMDISPDSPWCDHIVNEFRRVVEAGFDGIHMDQYGFPKIALRRAGDREETVDLAQCYPALINRTKEAVREIDSKAGLIFNNVSSYPMHTTAQADQEAAYIEVWPPVIRLRELKGLIDRGRELSGGKQVILSAYLPSFYPKFQNDPVWAENGAVLTMAAIFASGGYHLLLGEDDRMLTMAYYPDYAAMRPEFITEVRCYYDFIVRYGKLLYDSRLEDLSYTYTGGVNTEVSLSGEAVFAPNGDVGKVWTIIKRLPDYLILHLVNLVGIEDDYWEHGKKNRPEPQREIVCTILMEHQVKGIYAASPDEPLCEARPLAFERVEHEQGLAARFVIPELKVWTMIYVKWEK